MYISKHANPYSADNNNRRTPAITSLWLAWQINQELEARAIPEKAQRMRT